MRSVAYSLLFFALPCCGWAEDKPKSLLILVQGPDGHPVTTHEFIAGGEIMRRLLVDVPGLKVDVQRVDTEDGDILAEKIAAADGLALYLAQGARWLESGERNKQAIVKVAGRGGGLFALHWAIGAHDVKYVAPFVELFGACHGGADRKYKVLETRVTPAEHPATKGLKPFKIHDEFYYQLKTDPKHERFTPLLTAEIDGQSPFVAWGWQRPNDGRSAGFSGGHFHANWKSPEYQRFIAQTILWTMRIEPPRENFPPKLPDEVFQLPKRESGAGG